MTPPNWPTGKLTDDEKLEIFLRALWADMMRVEPPDTYNADDDLRESIAEGFRAVKDRVAAGGRGWHGWPPDVDAPR